MRPEAWQKARMIQHCSKKICAQVWNNMSSKWCRNVFILWLQVMQVLKTVVQTSVIITTLLYWLSNMQIQVFSFPVFCCKLKHIFIKVEIFAMHKQNCWYCCKYLEGATPTRLGPSPLKSERGPSLSRINLERNKRFQFMLSWSFHRDTEQAHSKFDLMCIIEIHTIGRIILLLAGE